MRAISVVRCVRLRPVRALWTHQLHTVHAMREQDDRNRHALERLLYRYAYFPLSLRTLRIVPTTSRIRELVGTFLADRTATQYDRLLASSCCPSVRLSVTLCIVALRVGVHG